MTAKKNGATAETNWPASKVSMWPIEKIKPYDRNPRTHPPAQIDIIAAAMLHLTYQ